MQAGQLNRPVTIKRMDTVQDDWGQPVSGWVEVATFWGDIRQLSGLETVRSNVEVSEVKASIRIRYRPGISAAMVAESGGLTYGIEAVLIDANRRDYMDLICKVTP